MKKFQEKLLNVLMPISNKIEQQKHIQAIKDGMISIVPLIVVGSVCLLPIGIMNLLGSGAVHDFLATNLGYFTYAAGFTSDLLSIFAVYFISKRLSEEYGYKTNQIAVTAIIVQLILCATISDGQMKMGFLGASGLFTAIITAIVVVEVYHLCYKKKLYIKLPDSVPSMVQDSFASLVPLFLNVIIAVVVTNLSQNLGGKLFPELVMSIFAPAIKTMDTIPAVMIVVLITQLLWFFGLHGPSITSAVWAPFAIAYGAENMALIASGQAPTHIFTFSFYYAILQISGSGLTFGLNLLMLRSKSDSLKAVGKVSIIPAIFGINEPLIFGTPLLLNPFMFIPFVFGPTIMSGLAFASMKYGLVGMPIAEAPGFLPVGLGSYIMTLDWKAPVLVVVMLLLMTLIYYPFFKMYEKEQLLKDQQN